MPVYKSMFLSAYGSGPTNGNAWKITNSEMKFNKETENRMLFRKFFPSEMAKIEGEGD
jgi:hypothetical protein